MICTRKIPIAIGAAVAAVAVIAAGTQPVGALDAREEMRQAAAFPRALTRHTR